MRPDVRPVKEINGRNGTTHAALYAPHPDLSACVRAYLSRSTTEAAALTPEERHNHFPPTPTCVFVWLIQGQDSRIPACRPPDGGPCRPPVVFSGPHTRPSFSVNNGPVHFFTLLLYPDALRTLTGMAVEPHLNRYSDFWDLFDSAWHAMAHAVFHAPDDAARVRLIEDFLHPRCSTAREEPGTREYPHRIGAWSDRVARRAARHVRHLSERQVDRRIKDRTGQNLRQLRGLGRLETVLLAANQVTEQPAPHWTALAMDSGFSDQAHLCRAFRRYLGMRPGELRRSLLHESAWVYRVWA